MNRFPKCMSVVATALGLLASPAIAQQQGLFRFTSVGHGSAYSLDVGTVPGVSYVLALMLPTSQPAGQYWQITGARNGDVRLSNLFSGPNQCLDVEPSGALYMDTCGLQIGQRWQIREVIGQGVQVTNSFKPGHCLDVFIGTQRAPAALIPCSGSASQIWNVSLTGR